MIIRQLQRGLVEYAHDVLVSLWLPYDEIVHPDKFKVVGLLESAIGRPFQTYGGEDLYPSLPSKAAALFHSLTCNHCFSNGNKRTAIISLHFFLLDNERLLVTSNADLYKIANATAEANRNERKSEEVMKELTEFIEEETIEIADLTNPQVLKALGYERMNKLMDRIEWTQQMMATIIDSPEGI